MGVVGVTMSIVLFIIGICNKNQWVGLIDIGLYVIFYLISSLYIRWWTTFNEVKSERSKGGQR